MISNRASPTSTYIIVSFAYFAQSSYSVSPYSPTTTRHHHHDTEITG